MIPHGTRRGYEKHRRDGEQPCTECLAANAEFAREWRHARKSKAAEALQASRSAMQRLALKHPDEYSALLFEEQAKRGVA